MSAVLALLALSVVAITMASRDGIHNHSSARHLLSTAGGSERPPFGLEQDDVCDVCMDRPRASNDSNLPVGSWQNHNDNNSILFFPECHGYQYCEPCIIKICRDPSESYGRCPSCRRPMHPSLPSIMQRMRAQRADDPEQRYHSHIERLQREDNSMCKYLEIWTIHHPLRHCIRNRYYQCLNYVFDDDWLQRDSKGCCLEFSILACEPACFFCELLWMIGFLIGNTSTLMCCCIDCFYGTFCRDFCYCEAPLDPEVMF